MLLYTNAIPPIGTEERFPTPSPKALTLRLVERGYFPTLLSNIILVVHNGLNRPWCFGSQCGDNGSITDLRLVFINWLILGKVGFRKENLIKIDAAWDTLCGEYTENTS